jgi:hypothetical protein
MGLSYGHYSACVNKKLLVKIALFLTNKKAARLCGYEAGDSGDYIELADCVWTGRRRRCTVRVSWVVLTAIAVTIT